MSKVRRCQPGGFIMISEHMCPCSKSGIVDMCERADCVTWMCVCVCSVGEQIRKRRCKAAFSYLPQHEDELELKVGDIIEILAEVRPTCFTTLNKWTDRILSHLCTSNRYKLDNLIRFSPLDKTNNHSRFIYAADLQRFEKKTWDTIKTIINVN